MVVGSLLDVGPVDVRHHCDGAVTSTVAEAAMVAQIWSMTTSSSWTSVPWKSSSTASYILRRSHANRPRADRRIDSRMRKVNHQRRTHEILEHTAAAFHQRVGDHA